MVLFLLAAIVGAALSGGGFYFGFKIGQRVDKEVDKKGVKIPLARNPQCYVIDPKDFDEEDRAE